MQKKLRSHDLFIIWFVCTVTIAEITTGSLISPLGLKNGILAIVLGHLIGIVFFFLCGYIGAKEKLAAMETTQISFGKIGKYLFSVLNIIQLIGWTAVIEVIAGDSINAISKGLWGFDHSEFWSVLIGVLMCTWIFLGCRIGIAKINYIAVILLLILVMLFNIVIIKHITDLTQGVILQNINFSQALVLSFSMIISWLPLVSDTTMRLKKPLKGVFFSSLGYFIGSCWMFLTGFLATLVTGATNPFEIAIKLKIGILVLVLILVSTVTGSFVDANSAGINSINLLPKLPPKYAAFIMAVIGTLLIQLLPIEHYVHFLTFIGAIFSPLFVIIIVDYYIFRSSFHTKMIHVQAVIVWLFGIWLYYYLLKFNSIWSTTLPAIVITAGVYYITRVMGNAYARSKK